MNPLIDAVRSRAGSQSFRCLCCGSETAELFLNNCRDLYMGKPGSFDYYRCEVCRVVQLSPVPEDMSRYYELYQVHSEKSALHEVARRLLMRKGYYKLPPGSRKLRVMDYGCGDGWYLGDVKERGHTAVGFETNSAHAEQLSRKFNLPVFSDRAALLREGAASFDLVTMHFVVEHVTDLHETFHIASTLLVEGGVFYFTIPNIGSSEFRIFGRRWHGLDAPRHVSFLNEGAIHRLAEANQFEAQQFERFGLPSDIAGSLSTAILGHYDYRAFCVMVPIATMWAYGFGQGDLSATLVKRSS